ncbi:MAG: Gfo/Idh/MocA family oxidoreductase [Chitinophagales bacterium]|nr:Gfo/Idh/MocA family oxidoreductase [Chitinophagales bacterium]
MKQVIQNFKSGELYVDDVPVPSISEGMVLIDNRFSCVSAGTEKGTVSVAQSSLLGKAKKRPDLVKQVLANYRKEGLKATIDKVRTKLDSLAALGYSSSGVVIASMDTNGFFKPGDRVACAGQNYASHADVVAVPQNLVVKIPENTSFEAASFTTMGAIALQGIRQADPRLGENVCVIGLGLLGQLTCQMLTANGCNVFGIDLSQATVDLANNMNVATAVNRKDEILIRRCENFTNGHGFDKIIITAAAPSNDPIELSAEIARKKAAVVVVGAVKMDVPRDPHFYRKELELKMSCSYGPGRYDPTYEEFGQDYPYAYVRFTEQRNMETFLSLIDKGAIKIDPLISHVYSIDEATKAYDLILGKVQEAFTGILIQYQPTNIEDEKPVVVNSTPVSSINCAFIGAGSFAQSYLIPSAGKKASLDTVVTRTGINAKSVASKFKFGKASTNAEDVFTDDNINTVFIATQHDSHAKYTIQALKNGKHVFVEKPLAMNMEELEEVKQAYESSGKILFVGYNRRFSPSCVDAKNKFENIGEPLLINMRINAGFIPKDHWTQTKAGGGRIIGEICHFIDLMQFLTSSSADTVYAQSIDSSNEAMVNEDNINITVKFKNGSVANLLYAANADKSLSKESIEIFGGNIAYTIDNFRSAAIYQDNKMSKLNLSGKGHAQEVAAFLNAVEKGEASPIPFSSLIETSVITFKIKDSLTTGLPQKLD